MYNLYNFIPFYTASLTSYAPASSAVNISQTAGFRFQFLKIISVFRMLKFNLGPRVSLLCLPWSLDDQGRQRRETLGTRLA